MSPAELEDLGCKLTSCRTAFPTAEDAAKHIKIILEGLEGNRCNVKSISKSNYHLTSKGAGYEEPLAATATYSRARAILEQINSIGYSCCVGVGASKELAKEAATSAGPDGVALSPVEPSDQDGEEGVHPWQPFSPEAKQSQRGKEEERDASGCDEESSVGHMMQEEGTEERAGKRKSPANPSDGSGGLQGQSERKRRYFGCTNDSDEAKLTQEEAPVATPPPSEAKEPAEGGGMGFWELVASSLNGASPKLTQLLRSMRPGEREEESMSFLESKGLEGVAASDGVFKGWSWKGWLGLGESSCEEEGDSDDGDTPRKLRSIKRRL
ncbi:unnamed protein product [Chrysoparadoxa australica]